jgi:hypothetical protein
MLSTNGRYTVKQRKYLEVLANTTQENVYSKGHLVVSASIPLLVKLNVLFKKEAALKDMVQDFYKYLAYAKSQEHLSS